MSGRVRVDGTDMRILREVFGGEGEDTFRSDRLAVDAVAKRLGLHRNTVSQRMRRLAEARVFLPATLEVEPAQFDLVACLAFLDVPPERRTAQTRDRLFALPGVQTLLAFVQGWEVVAYARTGADLEALLAEAARVCGAREARVDLWSARDYPAPERARLTRLDGEILRALLADARAPFPAVAAQAGTTAMTAKRRYERLRDLGVVYLYPASGSPVEGVSLGFLLADVPRPEDEAGAKAALEKAVDGFFLRNLAARGRAFFMTYGRSVAELEAQAARSRAVEGVAGVELRVMSELVRNPAFAPWLDDAIRRRCVDP